MGFTPADRANARVLARFGEGFALETGYTVRGIFQAPGRVADPYTGGVMTTAPTVIIDEATVAEHEIGHGTILTRQTDGTVYQVAGAPELDGAGCAVMALTKDF